MDGQRWSQPHKPYVRRALQDADLSTLEAVGFRRNGQVVELAFVMTRVPSADELEAINDIEGELIADFGFDEYDEVRTSIGTRDKLDLQGYELVEL